MANGTPDLTTDDAATALTPPPPLNLPSYDPNSVSGRLMSGISDPAVQGLYGSASRLLELGMPSPYKLPIGNVVGQGLVGFGGGVLNSLQIQAAQMQAQKAAQEGWGAYAQNRLLQAQMPFKIAQQRYLTNVIADFSRDPEAAQKKYGGDLNAVLNGVGGGGGGTPQAQPTSDAAPPTFGTYAAGIKDFEGTGRNPRSTASGVGQPINATWQSFVDANPGGIFTGKSPAEIAAMRNDDATGTQFINWYASQNANLLQLSGVPVTGQTLGLAHFLGPHSVPSLMNAPDNMSMRDYMVSRGGAKYADDIIQANPGLANMTVGQLRAKYARLPEKPDFLSASGRAPVRPPTSAAAPLTPGVAAPAQPAPPAPPPVTAQEGQTASAAPVAAPGPRPNLFVGPGAPTPTGPPPAPSEAAKSDADAIASGADASAASHGRAPPVNAPASSANAANSSAREVAAALPPPGVNITPQQAFAIASALNRRAMLGDLLGMPIMGDPQILRQQAQMFLQYGLGPSEEGQKELQRQLVRLRTEPAIAQATANATLETDLFKQGWRPDGKGGIEPVPGMQHDPTQIGAEKSAAETAQKLVDYKFAQQIAIQENLAKPIDLSRPGAQIGVRQPDGSTLWYTSPVIEDKVLENGDVGKVMISRPPPDAPAGTKPLVAPVLNSDGTPLITKSPSREEFTKERAKGLGETFAETDKAANEAMASNYLFDNMRNETSGWTMGRGAVALDEARNWLLAIGHTAFDLEDKDMPQLTQKVADYASFEKNAGMVLRGEVKKTSGRAAVQEYNMIAETLPTTEMSEEAFRRVVDQWQGLNDYAIAKQKFMQNYPNNPQVFEADWNKNVSATTFMINRMIQTPEGRQHWEQIRDKLNETKLGQAQLNKLQEKYNYAKSAGLFD